jgi:hypothetical protein
LTGKPTIQALLVSIYGSKYCTSFYRGMKSQLLTGQVLHQVNNEGHHTLSGYWNNITPGEEVGLHFKINLLDQQPEVNKPTEIVTKRRKKDKTDLEKAVSNTRSEKEHQGY